MRYQIYEAKSVKYDAQQRVGIRTLIPAHPVYPEKGKNAYPVRDLFPLRSLTELLGDHRTSSERIGPRVCSFKNP